MHGWKCAISRTVSDDMWFEIIIKQAFVMYLKNDKLWKTF